MSGLSWQTRYNSSWTIYCVLMSYLKLIWNLEVFTTLNHSYRVDMFQLILTCPCYLQTSNTGHISHMIQRASRQDNHTRAGPYKTKTKLPNRLNSKKYCINEKLYFTNTGSFFPVKHRYAKKHLNTVTLTFYLKI